jgi:hypothetical protein
VPAVCAIEAKRDKLQQKSQDTKNAATTFSAGPRPDMAETDAAQTQGTPQGAVPASGHLMHPAASDDAKDEGCDQRRPDSTRNDNALQQAPHHFPDGMAIPPPAARKASVDRVEEFHGE